METRSPPIAKVTRPIPTGVYSRKRLFDLLDRKQKYPVIWISGPQGCGKTTMVTSYIETRIRLKNRIFGIRSLMNC